MRRKSLRESSDTTKQYIGDAVYAELEGGMLKLTTEDGIESTNTIYLEPEVFYRLMEYARHQGWQWEEVK